MNIFSVFVAATLLFVYPAFATTQLDVKALSELPENDIDIGRVALLLAQEVFPEIDVDAYSAKIDGIVTEVKKLTRGSKDPDYRVRALNTYLYQMYGMRYDETDPYVTDPRNRYINGLLDIRKGSCANMPLLYLAVAQRLGYPVYAVSVPQHYFLRYVDMGLKMQNIEATGGGGFSPDEEYIATLQISPEALQHGTYLRTHTHREYLGILIEQNGIYWGMNGNNEKAIEYLEIATRLNPRSADAMRSLGVAYKNQSKKVKEPLSQEYETKADECFAKARQWGATNLPLKDYVATQQKAQEEFRRNQ